MIGYHYFLLRVYENLTDKEDFRSLGNECYYSSEELTVPNIYRNAKGFFFPVIFCAESPSEMSVHMSVYLRLF